MALNGIQIQKLLPKTNCKECGSNTCLAFAMKLAAKKANLTECPYASEEAKSVLGAASEPPVKSVMLGSEIASKIGEETVLYRHEKTFVNQTMFAINIDDNAGDMASTLEKIRDYKLDRVGEVLTVNAVAVTQKGDTAQFVSAVKQAYNTTKLPIIINATSSEALAEAATALKGTNSLIANVTKDTVEATRKLAEENGLILAISSGQH